MRRVLFLALGLIELQNIRRGRLTRYLLVYLIQYDQPTWRDRYAKYRKTKPPGQAGFSGRGASVNATTKRLRKRYKKNG